MEKVSVIVPIYKVEKYLHRCIDSIREQTYPHLEIILVNDGSPDQCGKIIEEYAAKDSRIIPINKNNGGLSDARNIGMKYVTGKYTLFVDSDDWLKRNMIEKLLYALTYYQADIIQSAFFYAYEDHLLFDQRYYEANHEPTVLDNEALMLELINNEKVKNFAWGKLYKTEIIKHIPFKKGVLFEDVFWAHQIMHHVNTYVLLHEPLCYYRQRNDSIVANYSVRNLDIIDGLKERHQFIEQHYPRLIDASYRMIMKNCFIHFNILAVSKKNNKEIASRKKELYLYIMANSNQFYQAVHDDQEMRRQLLLFKIHPYINLMFLFNRKILRKIKVLPQPESLQRINFTYRV